MLLDELVKTSVAVAATSSRRAKIEAISSLLRRAGPPEVPVVVAFLSGELRQRPIGVGYAALRDVAGGSWPPKVIPPGQGNPVHAGVASPEGVTSPEGAPDGTAGTPATHSRGCRRGLRSYWHGYRPGVAGGAAPIARGTIRRRE